MLNWQNKKKDGGIDWCTATWNVISGCNHGCEYCYCNRIGKRFGQDFKKYQCKPKYLNDLKSKKLIAGDRVFIGSTGDVFGDWVPTEDINIVLSAVRERPDVTFLFLTKNPKRYKEFNFNGNCLRGITIDTNKRAHDYIDKQDDFELDIDFISFEPLLEKPSPMLLEILQFSKAKWIIIGANSNPGEPKPPDEWADELIDRARFCKIKVFVKDNYKYHTRIKVL